MSPWVCAMHCMPDQYHAITFVSMVKCKNNTYCASTLYLILLSYEALFSVFFKYSGSERWMWRRQVVACQQGTDKLHLSTHQYSWFSFKMAYCNTTFITHITAMPKAEFTLEWRYNERDGVSNHRRLDSFVQPFVQAQIKENTKALCHWPLWGESTGDRWIPFKKGQ